MANEENQNESESLPLQLAKDGVESEAAYRAATEAERARIEAEVKQMQNRSSFDYAVQNTDLAEAIPNIIKAFSTAFLTVQQAQQQPVQPQQVQQQPVQPQQVNQSQNEQSPPSEEPSSAESPLRPDSEDIEHNDED